MRLPPHYQIATTPSSKSLRIKVQIQTTDTVEIHGVEGLVDCGADGEFIDSDYVRTNRIATRTLTRAIPLNNVDGTPNDNGPIKEVVDLVLQYKGHSERRVFAVTRLGKERLILGLPWLKAHNPEIDWTTGEVKLDRCPEKCRKCFEETQEERKAMRQKIKRTRACRAGPFPKVTIEEESEVEEEEDRKSFGDATIELEDRVFVTAIRSEE